jgi:general secretion pathway protein G
MRKTMSGFTIVELIIVVVVISVIATIIAVSYGTSQQKARNATRITDLKRMQDAVETYRAQNGIYPSTSGAWRGLCPAYGGTLDYIPGIGSYYEGSTLPTDPKWTNPTDSHCYLYRSNGTDYMILAFLTAEGICAGDPGDSCNPNEIRSFDRVNFTQASFAVYSSGAVNW